MTSLASKQKLLLEQPTPADERHTGPRVPFVGKGSSPSPACPFPRSRGSKSGRHGIGSIGSLGTVVYRKVSCTSGGRDALLVVQDLSVGEAGMIIDHHVILVEPDPRPGVRVADGSLAFGPPSTAVGKPAELLDVNVDQFPGPVLIIAAPSGALGTDEFSGDRVTPGQQWLLVAAQYPWHCPLRPPSCG